MYKYGIVVIGYKNDKGIKRLLTALNKADYFENNVMLIISIDHSDNDAVYNVANEFCWNNGEKIIRTVSERLGLRNHVLKCGNYLNEYNLDSLVVFEDDIMPSRDYFYFVKACTEKYIENNNIAGISLYTHCVNFQTGERFFPLKSEDNDVYFFQCAQSRGQVWFRNQWNNFKLWYEANKEKELKSPLMPQRVCDWPSTSWLKYHILYCIEKNKYFVYPYISFSTCFGEVGQHVRNNTNDFQVAISSGNKKSFNLPDFSLECILYDAFFENINLNKDLSLESEKLHVDLYGQATLIKCDYMLSSRKLNYPIIKKWGNRLIPHEMNIISDIEGEDFFLYDLRKYKKPVSIVNHFICNNKKIFLYGSGIEGKKWLERIGSDFVCGFIDSDESKAGLFIHNKRIYSVDEVMKEQGDIFIFVSTNQRNRNTIMSYLKDKGMLEKVVSVPYVHSDVRSKPDAKVDRLSSFEGKNYIDSLSEITNCEFGFGSYVGKNTVLYNTKIGKYSCIGPNVSIISGQHPTNTFVSVSPYFYSISNPVGTAYVDSQLFDEHRQTTGGYKVEIGNDVWIGSNVMLMEGVTIADGTIIAAGANVVNDTEPFSIVGGNPAKMIKYRFDSKEIDFLKKFKWWDRSQEWVTSNAYIFRDIKLFMEAFDGCWET